MEKDRAAQDRPPPSWWDRIHACGASMFQGGHPTSRQAWNFWSHVSMSWVPMCVRAHSQSVVPDTLQPRGLQPTGLLCPWNSPGKNIGVGCHALLQGIFPTQGSNPGLPHCWWILYHLNHQGSPVLCSNVCLNNDVEILTWVCFLKNRLGVFHGEVPELSETSESLLTPRRRRQGRFWRWLVCILPRRVGQGDLGHITKPTRRGFIPLSAHQFSPAPSQGWQTRHRQWAQLTNLPIPSLLVLQSPYPPPSLMPLTLPCAGRKPHICSGANRPPLVVQLCEELRTSQGRARIFATLTVSAHEGLVDGQLQGNWATG